MLTGLVSELALRVGVSSVQAARALAIILNANQRQGGGFAHALFSLMPRAESLAEAASELTGAPTDEISMIFEQTPAGRAAVFEAMLGQLHRAGFGPGKTALVIAALSQICADRWPQLPGLDLSQMRVPGTKDAGPGTLDIASPTQSFGAL